MVALHCTIHVQHITANMIAMLLTSNASDRDQNMATAQRIRNEIANTVKNMFIFYFN